MDSKPISQTEAARHLGVSQQDVSKLMRDHPEAPQVGGKPLWPAFNEWYWTVIRSPRPADLNAARARREAALAEQEELKLGQLRRELMTVADYDRALGRPLARVDARLKALSQRIAAIQWPADYAARLRRAVELVEEVRGELRSREEAT